MLHVMLDIITGIFLVVFVFYVEFFTNTLWNTSAAPNHSNKKRPFILYKSGYRMNENLINKFKITKWRSFK